VSFTFKERRFTKVHGELALRWPLEKISFVGVDPPSKYNFDLEKATKGEVSKRSKRALRKTCILAMDLAKWLQT
tara:strand:+ start:567 stop:788 length:222 start_codon:yes stop_codon:yes gene_type:complete